MNAIQILWPMAIGACLTLGLLQLPPPVRNQGWPWLTLLSFSIAGIAAAEFVAMHAPDSLAYGRALLWMQVPVSTAFIAIVACVRRFPGSGSRWPGALVLAVQAVCLATHFLAGATLGDAGIIGLREIRFLGEPVKVAGLVPSPRNWLAGLAILLLAALLADSALKLWRSRNCRSRKAALALGGCAVFFLVLVPLQAAFFHPEKVGIPYLVGFPFAAMLAPGVMACGRGGKPSHAGTATATCRGNEQGGARSPHHEEFSRIALVSTLSEFSGSLAHELNQPLAIILANAQAAQRLLVQSPPDLEEVKEILSDIVDEDRRAGDVVQRLRALLKRGETKMMPVSLNEIATAVLHLTHGDLSERGIRISQNLAPDLPASTGDRVQLKQVLLNLILNATESMARMPPETRHLLVSTAAINGSVLLAVRDQGTGLPDNIEPLFEPFHTTKPEGLGMGLAISRSIMVAHGGHLRARSNPEGGATFELELPALFQEGVKSATPRRDIGEESLHSMTNSESGWS